MQPFLKAGYVGDYASTTIKYGGKTCKKAQLALIINQNVTYVSYINVYMDRQ